MKSFMRLMLVGCFLTVVTGRVMAGDDLETKIKSMASANAQSYIKPIVSGFGVAMNSGIFRSPETHSVLGFDFQLVTAAAFAPSSEKEYTPALPSNLYQGPTKTSTAIGKSKNSTYLLNGVQNDQTDIILPGGVDAPFGASGMFVAPQLTVGVPFKTDVILRFVPGIPAGELGKVKLFGLGVKHNLNQWLPLSLPIDLAAGAFYQKMSIGDVFSAKATSFDVLAGKSLNLLIIKLGVYGGVGIESSTMDIEYETSGTESQGIPDGTKIKFSIDGKNSMRGIVGANIRLMWLLNVNPEFSFGKYKSASVGVGVTIR